MKANGAHPSSFTRLVELDEARRISSPGTRIKEIRRQIRPLHDRITNAGPAACVRTCDIVTFPYPTPFAMGGAALSPAPFVMMTNRANLVQVRWQGELINILVNPTDPERSLEAPFFAKQIERYGEFVSRKLLSTRHGNIENSLQRWNVDPEDIHYITFDHLHVQDLRGWLGSTECEEGRREPTAAYFPNAKLLVQKEELETFHELHPLHRPWYVENGIRGIPTDRFEILDGDYLIGTGFAIVRTPGHTRGNHSPVLVTERGVWTISENGVSVESYAPQYSKIPGIQSYARQANVEVILNANTRENTLEQYTSMIIEKELADPCPTRPEFPQHFPSSELTKSALAPGLSPTFTHGDITHGNVQHA